MHVHPQLIQHLRPRCGLARLAHRAAEEALNSTYVKFSLLALSSIFFLVDPFAAIPSFIAITSGVDPVRRRAWRGKPP